MKVFSHFLVDVFDHILRAFGFGVVVIEQVSAQVILSSWSHQSDQEPQEHVQMTGRRRQRAVDRRTEELDHRPILVRALKPRHSAWFDHIFPVFSKRHVHIHRGHVFLDSKVNKLEDPRAQVFVSSFDLGG